MTGSDLALLAGGGVCALVALVHGVLMGRYIITPIDAALANTSTSGGGMNGGSRRLVTPLLHYSTFAWLTGGLAVMMTAVALGREAQMAVGLLVGATCVYAALANLMATRARHPGGWLMALAAALIAGGLLTG